MTVLAELQASVQLVGWMLLHSLWQGVLIGVLYGIVRELLPRGVARYRLGMASLFGLAVCPLFTLWWLATAASETSWLASGIVVVNQHVQAVVTDPATGARVSVLDTLLPWLVLLWALGVLLLSFRAWFQWRELRAVVRKAEVDTRWQLQIATLADRLGLRRQVAVLRSTVAATPALVGWIRPVILLPTAVVVNFPVGQIELILAHELAHLRRWDPLANLFQVLTETILFYHPVVHWISRDVRNEREICCDSLALSVSGRSRHEFVEALAELGELRERHAPTLLAANGGALFDRVQQMLLPDHENIQRTRASFGLMALLFVALLMAFTLQIQWRRSALPKDALAAVVPLKQAWPLQLPRLSLAPAGRAKSARDLTTASVALPRIPVMKSPVPDGAVVPRSGALVATMAGALPHLPLMPIESPASVHFAEPEPRAPGAPVATASFSAAPTAIQLRQPVYPRAALARGIEGNVVIEFGLTADGGVSNPRVVAAQPSGIFDKAAIDAVRAWKFGLPPVSGRSARYRQTLVFNIGVNASRSGHRTQGNGKTLPRNDCRVITGTHICRQSDETSREAGLDIIRTGQH